MRRSSALFREFGRALSVSVFLGSLWRASLLLLLLGILVALVRLNVRADKIFYVLNGGCG